MALKKSRWYSNLIPAPKPENTIYREQSQGNYTIVIDTNAYNYWIELFHDNEYVQTYHNQNILVVEKKTAVGWHNISFKFIYNCSTDEEGYPVPEYNVTLYYGAFWYETVQFFEVAIRYLPIQTALAISDFDVDNVLTYLDGELVQSAQNLSMPSYANYSYIFNNRIWIRNTMPLHTLKVCDLLGRKIIEQQIDLSTFKYALLELPLEQLSIVNLDKKPKKIEIKPLGEEEYILTPEIAPGQIITYWVKNGTYEYTLYILQEYYDSKGVLQHIWVKQGKKIVKVPITIILPLQSSDDDDEQSFWEKYGIYIILGGFLLLFLAISYGFKKLKELNTLAYLRAEKENKKLQATIRSLFIDESLAKGYRIAKRGKKK